MKYYLIAGEASGDLHASKIIEELQKADKNAEFRFFGGDEMKSKGGTLVKHYKDMAFMGLWEVIKNLGKIKDNINLCKADIKNWQPDTLVLIDYAGFNLKIAEFAKNLNIKVIYYISPKVWVWKKSRIKIIKKYVDNMFVIFPFEVDFYKKYNYKVEYLGNPTVEEVTKELEQDFDAKQFKEENNLSEKPIIALLPGSREQEVSKILPEMLKIINQFPDYQFVIAGVKSLEKSVYNNFLSQKNTAIVFDNTYKLLRISHTAVVTSGTATLETAIFKIPQVVCYKTSKLSYIVGKSLVSIKFFSLVNILMNKQVVAELLQKNLADDIANELSKLLKDEKYRSEMMQNYSKLSQLLGDCGNSTKIAKRIMEISNK